MIPILGAESAYCQTGHSGQDYVEASSFDDLLHSLDRLKVDVEWRRSLIAKGKLQSQAYTADKIVHQWQVFLKAVAIPAYEQWRLYSPKQRKRALASARYANYQDRMSRKSHQFFTKALQR